MSDLFIGLMSGTSLDGIDAALVDFSHHKPNVIATHYTPHSAPLRAQILALCQPGENEIQRMGELDIILGKAFGLAVNELLSKQKLSAQDIVAIGSHGQTIRHHPHQPHAFTLQIGDPNTIAAETGITTVADFRRKDIALGGHGAPLVPAFHQHLFANAKHNLAIVNIGGIANVTLLPVNQPENIIGFDTGPGNVLLDAWIQLHKNDTHDKDGAWGASGQVDQPLLANMLKDTFFQTPPPKSTGREYFNLTWLNQQLALRAASLSPADIQATLTELTAQSILNEIKKHFAQAEILICGGGVKNTLLMSRLTQLGKQDYSIASTQMYGVDPDWMEAMAFAWLAQQTLKQQSGNLPSVTGAKQKAVLGGIYYAN